MEIDVLMKKGKSAAGAYVQSECLRNTRPSTLLKLLDHFLDPMKPIDDVNSIEWIKRLMAGGAEIEEFIRTVRKYDTSSTCGLVWTANFVAYRCRTCGISTCMSLCAECFKRGDHSGHDFNMFRSQAGGACDCGDTNVMKECGFCPLHGTGRNLNTEEPEDLLVVARVVVPRLILRLVLHMRANSNSLTGFLGAMESADGFIQMLHEMSGMGAAMRAVMSSSFVNPVVYKNLLEEEETEFLAKAKENYEEALGTLQNPEPPEEYKDIPSLQKTLTHRTFLEEFVFWTAKFEFPQRIVCLLLNLLPDADYKESFTRAFVLHYSRISQLLVNCNNPDMLSNRVVHVSVQLFSNEKLALKMAEEMKLLHVMVISLNYMMKRITVNGTVDCGNLVMKDHCYWPLVSDLNNILSHRPVAMKFLQDDGLLTMWFQFLAMFQGMNVNIREMNQHIEFEPSTYYAAFSAELEASASPMWALASHLKDISTAHLTRNLLNHCRSHLNNWVNYVEEPNPSTVSFHLPLHRYYSVFLQQAVKYQNQKLSELLPPNFELLKIIQHPLRVQSAFYEIISGLWVRNGLQIKGQAMTYVQCHFCNSMVDADIYLLQVASVNLDSAMFLTGLLEKFHCSTTLSLSTPPPPIPSYLEPDQTVLMLENCAIFLTTLSSVRTSLGLSDAELIRLEMITLLCMGDKTHSQLMELIPERCGNQQQSRDFEQCLSEVADYHAPNFESSGNMLQGMYVPKPFVWDEIYDPIYILLRAVHRRDFQTSLDRFAEHTAKTRSTATSPWPPFRLPLLSSSPYTDPRRILNSRVLHGICFTIFYKSLNGATVSDHLVALAIFLLEMGLSVESNDGKVLTTLERTYAGKYDMNFTTWYNTDNLYDNMRTEIDEVVVRGCGDEMEMESLEDSTDALATISTPRPRLAIMASGADLELVLARNQSEMPSIQPIHESIISLLLKLHSKLSGRPNSYPSKNPNLDGPFHIGRLLDKLKNDPTCNDYIESSVTKIWPNIEVPVKNIIKSKAEERRIKMLADMQAKQKSWMEKFGEEMEVEEKYECVICSQGKNEVVGVVVLVQKSSVLEWGRSGVHLPITQGETIPERVKLPWTDGLLATTCGHHIHGECLKGYLNALKSQQRQHNISIERGEYACPLCRQLANHFLPIEDSNSTENLIVATRKAFDDLKNLSPNSLNFTRNTLRLNLEIELLLGDKTKTCFLPLLSALRSGHESTADGSDPCDLLIDHVLGMPLGSDIAHFNEFVSRIESPNLKFYSISNLIMKHLYGVPPAGGGLLPLVSLPGASTLLLVSPHTVGDSSPSLLLLPHLYDTLFQHYHRGTCFQCQGVPKDPSVCLICGTLVCMREPCCKNGNVFEATSHSLSCGSGTCIYLSVNSSTIVVIRGKRACLWGSVFLDSFGEEDRELKRGKPLYLCKERYDLLERQWIEHRFDHTARKWIFHRDTL